MRYLNGYFSASSPNPYRAQLVSQNYLVPDRLMTHSEVVDEVVAENELSVGVILAVRFCLPVTGGFHEHVAE
jgi:hypothetical protein